jgi:predicted aspartyl protease
MPDLLRRAARVFALGASLAAGALLAGCATPADLRPEPTAALIEGEAPSVVLPTRRCANYFLADVTINGRGPYAMLVDTGASHTVVSARVARDLEADATPMALGAARGSQGRTQKIESLVRARSLRAGALELREFNAITLDLAGVQAALGTRLDGILGYNAFGGLLLTFDYPASEVRVARGALPTPDGDRVLKLVSQERPEVVARVNGRPRTMLIDTGKAGAFTLSRFDRLDFLAPPADVSTGVAIGGSFVLRAGRLADDVTLGGVTFARPIVENSDSSDLIGAEALKPFVVTFDARRARVRLEGAPEPVTFPPVRGIGVGFEYTDQAWTVSDVFPGTPAELAGLKRGDVVVRLAGKRLHELSCTRQRDLFATGDTIDVAVIRDRRRVNVTVPVITVVP